MEEVNKIVLSANHDKRIPSIDYTEVYGYGKSKEIIHKNVKIKCNNEIKQIYIKSNVIIKQYI